MQGREDKAIDMLVNMLDKYDELHVEIYEEEDTRERKALIRQRNSQYVLYLGACAAFDLAFDLEPGTMDSCAKVVYDHRKLY